ncbi:MAG: ArnT family glycosyltransferase [Armatimonadota bacterium]
MSADNSTVGGRTTLDTIVRSTRISWKHVGIVVGVFVVLAGVSARFYKNTFELLLDRESLDVAQIARSIAEGQGFTTLFLRPLNVGLLAGSGDPTVELNHAPLYPYTLAVAFKLRSPSDQVAVWVSLVFLFATLVATHFLGKVIFDWRTGLLAASALGISAHVLRVGTLGQEWTMAAFWFSLLLILVALHHRSAMVERPLAGAFFAAAGALCCTLLYLTHHVFIVLAIPAAVYFGVTGSWRKVHLSVFLVVLVLSAAPWAYRNYLTTGVPILGVNAWDLMACTDAYPGDVIYRSSSEDVRSLSTLLLFPIEHFHAFARKLIDGSSEQFMAFVSLIGIAVSGFMVVSSLYRFKNPTANAVRGLAYGLVPLGILAMALYKLQKHAVIIFAPLAAVYGASYFLLLLDAKKLHPFYRRVLVGGFLFLAGYQTIAPIFWRMPWEDNVNANKPAHVYFAMLGERGTRVPIYTDTPWIPAWRSKCLSAWLPVADADFDMLSAVGFPLQVIVLTPESDRFSPNEIWYVLHRIRMWREYLHDPESALDQILKMARVKPTDAPAVRRYIRRLKREYAVSSALEGFKPQPMDPLAPDDIQVLTREVEP